MFKMKGALRSIVAITTIVALVTPSAYVGAEPEEELGSNSLNITIQDLAREDAHSISTEGMDAKSIGKDTEYYESILQDPLTLYGSPFANVDLVEYGDVKKAEYQFIKVEENSTTPVFSELNQFKWKDLELDKSYRDIILDKKGQLSVQRYDVSSLEAQKEPNLWADRANVYTKPIGSMEHIKTDYSTTVAAYKGATDSNKTYVPNTVFMNNLTIGSDLKMAMKLWGYIIPDKIGQNNGGAFTDGDYYIGIISDDAAIGYITVPTPDGKSEQNIWFSDYFYHHASTFVTTNTPIYLKKGEPYPIYMEYFNWGGDAEFRVVYSKKPFTFKRVFTSVNNYTTENKPSQFYSQYVLAEKGKTDSVAQDGFKYLDRLIKEHNNKSSDAVSKNTSATTKNNVTTSNEVWEMPSTWFRGSSNTTPGERSTSVFMSKASEGVYFPASLGTYYLAVRMTSEDKNLEIKNTQVLMGPYIISDAVLTATKNPSNWTKNDVEIKIRPASGKTDTIAYVKLPDGKQATWSGTGTDKYISYTVSKNDMYKFKVKEIGGVEKDFDVFVDNIDKDAPVLDYTITPSDWTNGNVTINIIATDDKSKVHYLYDASGNKILNTDVEITITKAFDGFTKNGTYKFKAEDAVGNMSEELSVEIANIDKLSPVAGDSIVDIVWDPVALSPMASVILNAVDQEATDDNGKSDIRGITIEDGEEQPVSSVFIESANVGDVINYRIADNAGNVSGVITYIVGEATLPIESLVSNIAFQNMPKANGDPVSSVSIVPNGRAQGVLKFEVLHDLFLRDDDTPVMELSLTNTSKIMSVEITDFAGNPISCEFEKAKVIIKDNLFVGQYNVNVLVAIDDAILTVAGRTESVSIEPIELKPYGINVTNTLYIPWIDGATGSQFNYKVINNPKVN